MNVSSNTVVLSRVVRNVRIETMIGKKGYFSDTDGVKKEGTLTDIREGNFYKYVNETGTGYSNFEEMKEENELVGQLGWFWDDEQELEDENVAYGRLSKIDENETYSFRCNIEGFINFSTENPLEHKKKELTREEITTKWVNENDLKVGDKVRGVNTFGYHVQLGKVLKVKHIYSDSIELQSGKDESSYYYPVELLEKVTEQKYRPYTFEERQEFRNLWAVDKHDGEEYRITHLRKDRVLLGAKGYFTPFNELLEIYTKIDGTPFGKEL